MYMGRIKKSNINYDDPIREGPFDFVKGGMGWGIEECFLCTHTFFFSDQPSPKTFFLYS